jgi:hypothetical protein
VVALVWLHGQEACPESSENEVEDHQVEDGQGRMTASRYLTAVETGRGMAAGLE